VTIWLALLAAAPLAEAGRMVPDIVMAQVMIHQRTIVRIQTRSPAVARAPMTQWRERKGPKCVPMDRVGAAAVVADDSVDLLLRGGSRVRAQFADDCPDLDYYSGFYIARGPDGQVCAGRDSIHVRSGGECRIERFRALEEVGTKKRGTGMIDRIRRRLGR
jgi:hypothetical protein